MVAVFSNGKFDGVHEKMLHRLGKAGSKDEQQLRTALISSSVWRRTR
jgi:hypothetical protein